MSLDGHMILTTKGNEFFQAWLTFSDEDQINFNWKLNQRNSTWKFKR